MGFADAPSPSSAGMRMSADWRYMRELPFGLPEGQTHPTIKWFEVKDKITTVAS